VSINIYSAGETPLLRIRYMGCNRLPNTVNIGPMLRNSYIVHYVVRGRGFYNGVPVGTGMGFLIYPGHVEEYYADREDPWELLWVVSEDENMGKMFLAYDADPVTQVFRYCFCPAVIRVRDAMRMMTERVVSPAALLEMFLSVYKYHERSSLTDSSRPQGEVCAEFAVRYIHDNYQSQITVQELAELLNVSQPYLFRVFRQMTGKSPKQYLNDYRILQAKRLLTETAMTVTEVAGSVGYYDALAFSRFFSLKVGCSPRSYRNSSGKLPEFR